MIFPSGRFSTRTSLSVLGFLSVAHVAARTASIIPKDPKQVLKLFSAWVCWFAPLPLCIPAYPSRTAFRCHPSQMLLSRYPLSHQVEEAVHRTIRTTHRQDPIRYPTSFLPIHCRGRCRQLKYKTVRPSKAVRQDPTMSHDPPTETSSLMNHVPVFASLVHFRLPKAECLRNRVVGFNLRSRS